MVPLSTLIPIPSARRTDVRRCSSAVRWSFRLSVVLRNVRARREGGGGVGDFGDELFLLLAEEGHCKGLGLGGGEGGGEGDSLFGDWAVRVGWEGERLG